MLAADLAPSSGHRVTRSYLPWVGVVLVAFLMGLAVVFVPGWLVSFDLGARQVTGAERLKAVNDARVVLLQVVGGVAVAVGVFATLRRLRMNEEELRVSREGQITERYSRAVEHLGSESPDVRMGGIHALARVAQNSVTDRVSVQSVLSAFVRGHSPWPPTRPGQVPADVPLDAISSLAIRASDVQEAMTALTWLQRLGCVDRLAVPRVDLRYARLDEATMDRANLGFANLGRARFRRSSLRRANLHGTDLRYADLRGADLQGADLCAADLRSADLAQAVLVGARSDSRTKWPDGFDPDAAGVVLS